MDTLAVYVGVAGTIVGAVVGGVIGLLGQRMSIQAQKRKELLHLSADYIAVIDQFSTEVMTFVEGLPQLTDHERGNWQVQMATTLGAAKTRSNFIELAAPRNVGQQVVEMLVTSHDLYLATMKLDQTGEHNEAHRQAQSVFVQARARLIARINPSIYKTPLMSRLRSKLQRDLFAADPEL